MSKLIRIQEKLVRIVKINGVWFYKNHFCNHCGNRIPVRESHKQHDRGIPEYIWGHNRQFEKGNKIGFKKGNKYVGHKFTAEDKMWLKYGFKKGNNLCLKYGFQKGHKLQSGKRNSRYGISPPKSARHGKRCYYKSPLQGKVCFRSSWELAYAKYLDSRRILWKYEHKRFKLSNGTTYRPDFFLVKNKKYIEIKGYMYKNNKKRISLFKKEYPHIKFKILYKEDLIGKGINL